MALQQQLSKMACLFLIVATVGLTSNKDVCGLRMTGPGVGPTTTTTTPAGEDHHVPNEGGEEESNCPYHVLSAGNDEMEEDLEQQQRRLSSFSSCGKTTAAQQAPPRQLNIACLQHVPAHLSSEHAAKQFEARRALAGYSSRPHDGATVPCCCCTVPIPYFIAAPEDTPLKDRCGCIQEAAETVTCHDWTAEDKKDCYFKTCCGCCIGCILNWAVWDATKFNPASCVLDVIDHGNCTKYIHEVGKKWHDGGDSHPATVTPGAFLLSPPVNLVILRETPDGISYNESHHIQEVIRSKGIKDDGKSALYYVDGRPTRRIYFPDPVWACSAKFNGTYGSRGGGQIVVTDGGNRWSCTAVPGDDGSRRMEGVTMVAEETATAAASDQEEQLQMEEDDPSMSKERGGRRQGMPTTILSQRRKPNKLRQQEQQPREEEEEESFFSQIP